MGSKEREFKDIYSHSKNGKGKKKRKKWSKLKKALVISGASICTLAAVVVGLFFYYFGGLNTQYLTDDLQALGIDTDFLYHDKNVVNIALFGVDSRTDKNEGRSDAIMIVSLDYEHNKVKLTSIARDTYCNIPGRDAGTKINHAYAYGGAELAIKTLNTIFDLDIQDYVTVNFNQMAAVIDAVGGVSVPVSEAERVHANMYLQQGVSPITESGDSVLLTGGQAVAYSRIRKLDSDNMRTQRQRQVLNALFEKAKSLSVLQYPEFARKLLPMVETSLDYGNIMGMTGILASKPAMEQLAFPNEHSNAKGGTHSDGVWYYDYDLEVSKEQLHKFIYEDLTLEEQYTTPEVSSNAA